VPFSPATTRTHSPSIPTPERSLTLTLTPPPRTRFFGFGSGAAAPAKEEVKQEKKKKGDDLKVIELEGGELPASTATVEGNVKVTTTLQVLCSLFIVLHNRVLTTVDRMFSLWGFIQPLSLS
jgi:hypothetical protein